MGGSRDWLWQALEGKPDSAQKPCAAARSTGSAVDGGRFAQTLHWRANGSAGGSSRVWHGCGCDSRRGCGRGGGAGGGRGAPPGRVGGRPAGAAVGARGCGTAAAVPLAVAAGVEAVRVHEVAPTRDVIAVTMAIANAAE